MALMPFFYSCATYNEQAAPYYHSMLEGKYEKASNQLDRTRLLKRDRNRLLYLLEKGKMEHLIGHYEHSNNYLNEADLLMENGRTTVRDVAVGNLVNPMMKTYQGEDFEKYMVHYYKALNYLQLGLPEEAIVEARRITLRSYAQDDQIRSSHKYVSDAFSHMLQGLVYERGGDINNAFIAYRNAVDLYLERKGSYYGVALPEQLKKDLLRTAWQMGFTGEVEKYERLLETKYVREESPAGGELVVFWENGLAPVKTEQNLLFSLHDRGEGNLVFVDRGGFYNIPFDPDRHYRGERDVLNHLSALRVVIPRYETILPHFSGAMLSCNGAVYALEPAQNVNNLAIANLQERMLKELAQTLTRLAIKRLTEEIVEPDHDDKKGKDNKKKKDDDWQQALALGLKAFNIATEKADTRNWQSLPHTIYYTRIPLQPGENKLSIELSGGGSKRAPQSITVNGHGGLQFYSFCTIN
ncbi:MAG TPA: hypothetical protein VGE66_10430 [Chitinophagaceae bacterium]